MDRKKEQKIGQQIMAVRMIQQENSKVSKGGVSFLRKEQLANGMNVPKEEVDNLVSLCKRLDFDEIRFRVAGALYNAEIEFSYIYEALYWFGYTYMEAFISEDTVDFNFEKKEDIFVKRLYRNGELLNNSNREHCKSLFEKSLKYYAKTYIQEILTAYEEGADCDVIAEIVQFKVFGETITEDLIWKLKGIALDVKG